MNVVLLLFIINHLILRSWRLRSRLRPWRESLEWVQRRVEARQYDLSERAAEPGIRVFQELLRRGRLQPRALAALLTWIRQLEQADEARLRQGFSAALRLGLSALLALGASLYLERTWLFSLGTQPLLGFLLLGESLMLFVWLGRLPAHPLALSSELQQAFAAAVFGESPGGPWHEAWLSRQSEGWESGRDRSEEQRRVLENWLRDMGRGQEKSLIWAEELFGLVELAGSVYFLGTACALPLLKLWEA